MLDELKRRGFSVDNLENIRKFYMSLRDRISEPMIRKLENEKIELATRV